MKVTRVTILILLLVSVLFSLLNGCTKGSGGQEDEEEVITPLEILTADEDLTVGTTGEITDIKFNTKWIVVSNPLGIHIYNKEKTLRASLTGHQGIVQTIALSEGSKSFFFIAAGCSDGTIRIWSADKLEAEINKGSNKILIFTNENKDYYQDISTGHSGGVKRLVFPRESSKLLASRGNDHNIKLWEAEEFEELWNIDPEASTIDPDQTLSDPVNRISALTFSDDGTKLASGNLNGEVRTWKPGQTANEKIFPGDQNEEIIALVFLSGSQYIVSVNSASEIVLWDTLKAGVNAQKSKRKFVFDDSDEKDTPEVTALAFLNHSSLLVAGTAKGDIYFWKTTETEEEVKPSKPLQKHYASITALASSTEGTLLASGSKDGTIHISEENEISALFEE